MANEQRVHRDYFFGVLSAQATISDTTLSSTAFQVLPTTFSTTRYMPIEIHNPTTGAHEVVWITGHASGSSNVTVVRAKEGTSAQAWPAQSQVLDSATARDLLIVSTFSALPADAHLGARALVSDLGTAGVVMEKTPSGWGPAVGVALASQVGPNHHGSVNPPDDGVMLMRGGYINGSVADGSGGISVTFRTPFPTACTAVSVTSATFAAVGAFVVTTVTNTGFIARVHNGTTAVAGGTAVFGSYIAMGY